MDRESARRRWDTRPTGDVTRGFVRRSTVDPSGPLAAPGVAVPHQFLRGPRRKDRGQEARALRKDGESRRDPSPLSSCRCR